MFLISNSLSTKCNMSTSCCIPLLLQVGRDMAELASRILTNKSGSGYLSGLFRDVVFESGVDGSIETAVKRAQDDNMAICLLFGGETTVQVRGSGKGMLTR